MARNISSGIEQLADKRSTPIEKQVEQHERSWRDLRNKLDSMLIGTNVLKGDTVRRQCLDLDTMDQDQRYAHILNNWGVQYAERAKPLLNQLNSIEKEISRIKSKT